MKCQDVDEGGIGDRPGNMADIFHTFFGIAGLSLLGSFDRPKDESVTWKYAHYRPIDPTYALPIDLVKKLGIPHQTLSIN